jgi:hypothetical protein
MLPHNFAPKGVRVSLQDGDVSVDQSLGWLADERLPELTSHRDTHRTSGPSPGNTY